MDRRSGTAEAQGHGHPAVLTELLRGQRAGRACGGWAQSSFVDTLPWAGLLPYEQEDTEVSDGGEDAAVSVFL